MKTLSSSVTAFILVAAFVGATAQSMNITGAWQTDALNYQTTMICSERFFSVAIYDLTNKTFVSTHGGSYRIENGELIALLEFHSMNPELIGKELREKIRFQNGALEIRNPSGDVQWKRVDDGTPGRLAGAWLITGRVRNGEISTRSPGPRKTMKILSGTRFQWIAYNTETREFSGTGGGTYTTTDGKYTENIEFFSRDSSRVGASLVFDFSLEDKKWRHKGLSSNGQPIDEIWTQRERIR
jgi:hypothetical protein